MTQTSYSTFNPIEYEAHMLAYEKVDSQSKVLDVGCATGYFARELKKKNCRVWGVEKEEKASKRAKRYCEDVFKEDIESIAALPLRKKFFDYILLLDVLEHLKNPLKAVLFLKPYLKDEGKVIISVPNVAHIKVRLNLLLGKFNYEEKGIMDRNHLKFFTKETFLNLLDEAELNIDELDFSCDFGQLPVAGRAAKRAPKNYQYVITRTFNTLLAVQFIAVCDNKK